MEEVEVALDGDFEALPPVFCLGVGDGAEFGHVSCVGYKDVNFGVRGRGERVQGGLRGFGVDEVDAISPYRGVWV